MNRAQAPGPRPRLLIVDDETHIRSGLTRALTLLGYEAEDASSGQEALALLGRRTYDLMILDMRMPGLSGTDVIRRAHEVAPQTLIVVLTGNATLESAIAAVRSEEVVEYLLKPASVHDVAATVAHVLARRAERLERERLVLTISEAVRDLVSRREHSPAAPEGRSDERPLTVGGVALDRERRVVRRADLPERPIELTEGEAALLETLMRRPGQVLSCGELARLAWGYHLAAEEAQAPVRSMIFRLRQKIEVDATRPQLVQTVRGRGYVLASS